MYIYSTTIRLQDTDAAGVMFYSSLFRHIHDSYEDFLLDAGLSIRSLIEDRPYALPIVHAEANYLSPIKLGDQIDIQLSLKSRNLHSFTLQYILINEQAQKVATAETVHVAIDKQSGNKTDLPAILNELF